MGRISLSGKVVYMPGPWGLAVPAPGVDVSVFDKDIGNADDQIWSGTTQSNGGFNGTSSEWRDTKTVTVSTALGSVSTQEPDMTDVMALYIKVKQRIGNQLFEFTGPYLPPPPGLPALLVVLTWGPPGRTRITLNGAPVPTMQAFAERIGSLFGARASAAGYGVQHEICIFGEQIGSLRGAMQSLEGGLDELISKFGSIQQREAGARPGALTKVQGGLTSLKQHKMEFVGHLASAQSTLGAGAPPNPWEAARQSLLDFIRSLESVARRYAAACDSGVSGKHTSAAVVMVVATIVVAVVVAVAAISLTSLAGGLLVAAIVAAIVSAVVTVGQNISALLAACGYSDAAASMSAWYQQNSWFGAMLTAVSVFCAILILIASLPATGWTWVTENVTGPGGAQGMRFLISS